MKANNYVQGLAVESVQHEQLMLKLADEMAGAAVGFNSNQGYESFINARSTFQNVVHNYYEDVRAIAESLQKEKVL